MALLGEGSQFQMTHSHLYPVEYNTYTPFRAVQSLDRLGRRGDMTDDSAEIFFQSFLQEAIVSSSGMGRDVYALTLSIQHFLCRPRPGQPVVACDMPEPCKYAHSAKYGV